MLSRLAPWRPGRRGAREPGLRPRKRPPIRRPSDVLANGHHPSYNICRCVFYNAEFGRPVRAHGGVELRRVAIFERPEEE